MTTTAISSETWSPVASTPAPTASRAPSRHLTAAQVRELEGELRRELAALERRLTSEGHGESGEDSDVAVRQTPASTQRMSDTELRRDLVEAALARIASGVYGSCSHCGEPIPFGRLFVMPEATHCLSCSGRV